MESVGRVKVSKHKEMAGANKALEGTGLHDMTASAQPTLGMIYLI